MAGTCGLLALLVALGSVAAAERPAKPTTFLPGILQAEAFEEAGAGTPRLHAVPAGGQAVELREGDWLRYSVTVNQAGLYDLVFRVAHDVGSDPLFLLERDGTDITGTMNTPYTGGIEHWVTIERPMVRLDAGRHVFTLRQTGGTPFFLDAITFDPGGPVTPGPEPDPAKWRLTWSDEFDKDGAPDATKWSYDIGGHGWGNQELQYYTDRMVNSRVEDGRLIIEARKEDFAENHYTSARLVTRGRHDFTYGRVEVSAKLPKGQGSWPAIWLLGSSLPTVGWPACGEIDVMEHLGRNPGWIHGSTHSKKHYFKNGNQLTSISYVPEPHRDFHRYAIEWFSDHIDFFVDNNKYLTVTNEKSGRDAWPFDDPEYLILNVALGGWGGDVVDADLPARMEIDYVRIYVQK